MVFTAEVNFRVGVDTVCGVWWCIFPVIAQQKGARAIILFGFYIHTYKIEQIGHDIFIPTIEELLKKSSLKRCSLGED